MYPVNKSPRVSYSIRPWKEAPTPAISHPKMKFTPQEEIDVCLNCKRTTCNHGECPEIGKAKQLRVVLEVPDGFEADAVGGMKPKELADKYNLSEGQVYRFRRRFWLAVHHVTQVDLELFREDVESGMTLRRVMSKHHIGRKRALGIYEELGLSIPKKGGNKNGNKKGRNHHYQPH